MKRVVLAGMLLSAVTGYSQTLKDAMQSTENERYEKATSAFKALIAKDPTNAENYFYFGENYFYSDNSDSALLMYKKGIELNPKFPLNHVGYGKILWIDGKETEAKAMFDKTVASFEERGNRFAAELRGRTHLEIAEALIYNDKKDADVALSNIEKAIELDPKNPDGYMLKGDALFEKDKRDASEPMKMYKKAAEMDPRSAAPLAKKAYLYYRALNRESAVSTYGEAIALDANYAPAYRGRAEAYYQLKKLDLAIADYKTYLRLNNGNISARVRYAAFLFLAGKHQDALTEIQDIEKTNPNMILVKRIRGYAEYELGQYDKARATLEDYFSKQTENKFIWSDYDYMGKTLIKVDSDSIAVDFFIRLLRKDPSKRDVVIDVAANLYKDKKYRTAIRLVEATVKLAKPACNDWFYLGKSAERLDLFQKADTAYTKYIECNGEVYYGWRWRGGVRAMMDPKTETWAAKDDYIKAIEIAEKLDSTKFKAAIKDLQYVYFYLGSYYWLKEKNNSMAKCYFTKLVTRAPELDKGKEAAAFLNDRQEFKNATLPEGCK